MCHCFVTVKKVKPASLQHKLTFVVPYQPLGMNQSQLFISCWELVSLCFMSPIVVT